MREDVTEALAAINEGETGADDRLMPLVYDELRALAARAMKGERAGPTLDSTGLVHEAYLRLMGGEGSWQNRAHFFGAAANSMRRILVERARKRRRREDRIPRVPFADDIGLDVASLETPGDAIIELDAALNRLAKESPRKHEVVMLRYFAGLSIEGTAEVVQASVSTVKADWSFARTWLYREIRRGLSLE